MNRYTLTDAQYELRLSRRAQKIIRGLRASVEALRPPPGCLRHPFPLRRGMLVRFELPQDMTVAEVDRVREWLRWMPLPEPDEPAAQPDAAKGPEA